MGLRTIDDVRKMTVDQLWGLMAECGDPGYYQMAVEELQRRHLADVAGEVRSLSTSSSRLESMTRWLIGLTVVLVVLTAVLVWQTSLLMQQGTPEPPVPTVAAVAGEAPSFSWAFAQNIDGSFHPSELCRASLAESLYNPANADRLVQQGSSNVFLFSGTIESYRIHGFQSQAECETALTALVTRGETVRGKR